MAVEENITVSMITNSVDGIKVNMTEFGYKTFTMVVKSIGYFNKIASPTYLRTSGVMETTYGQPRVAPEYPKPSVEYIMNLYKKNQIEEYDTIVLGPGLEICCYIGLALKAPILPSQFITSAKNRQLVEENSSSQNIYIIGHETDWPNLCIWIKPKNLFQLYEDMLKKASTVVIFHYDSAPEFGNSLGTKRGFCFENVSILDPNYRNDDDWMKSSTRKNYLLNIQDPINNHYEYCNDMIAHWEFSMEQDQLRHFIDKANGMGKRVVVISSGDWQGFIPLLLFIKLYKKNGFIPTGITFNDYWCCHPFYESEFLRIPVISFQYASDVYVHEFKKVLDSVDFQEKNAEYMIWKGEFDRVTGMSPQHHFENWGFRTLYKTIRPYDVWHWQWQDNYDPRNPTREWIIPQLKKRTSYRDFKEPLSVEELIKVADQVKKTDVKVYG